MTTYINPLDFFTIFVNIFSGSLNIFIFLAVILIAVLAGKYRMPDKVFGGIILLFGVMFANYLGGLYALMLVITGLIVYYAVSKIWKM